MAAKSSLAVLACCALSLALSCAAPGPASGQPDWVDNARSRYPASAYLYAVESADTRRLAETRAQAALARQFNLSVASTERAARSLTRENGATHESASVSERVNTTSDVSDIIGLQTQVWAAPDGTIWALALLDRREAASRYAERIAQNEAGVQTLLTDAAGAGATFDACEAANRAANLARQTERFLDILSVLDERRAEALKPTYGGAPAVEAAAGKIAAGIGIAVEVQGPAAGHIAQDFAACFDEQGYKTAGAGQPSAYALRAVSTIDDAAGPGDNGLYALHWTLSASLVRATGARALSWSMAGREEWRDEAGARRAVARAAERAVKQDFAARLAAYLASLSGNGDE
jgi:hypothetical protein